MNNIFYLSTESVVGVEVTPLNFSNNLPIINLYIYIYECIKECSKQFYRTI